MLGWKMGLACPFCLEHNRSRVSSCCGRNRRLLSQILVSRERQIPLRVLEHTFNPLLFPHVMHHAGCGEEQTAGARLEHVSCSGEAVQSHSCLWWTGDQGLSHSSWVLFHACSSFGWLVLSFPRLINKAEKQGVEGCLNRRTALLFSIYLWFKLASFPHHRKSIRSLIYLFCSLEIKEKSVYMSVYYSVQV